MIDMVISCLSSCLTEVFGLCDIGEIKGKIDQAVNRLGDIARVGKGEHYYATVRLFVEDINKLFTYGQEVQVEKLGLEASIVADIQRLQKILEYKRSRDHIKLTEELREAIKEKFPVKILQDIVGNVIDVESLSEESKEEKFEKYIKVLNTDCPVCLVKFTPADFIAKKIHRTSCHHFYHQDCLSSWMEVSRDCPTCRVIINFTDEKANWKEYLRSIDGLVKEKFPDATLAEEENVPTDPDHLLALQLDREEREANDRARSIAEDRAVAMDLFNQQIG